MVRCRDGKIDFPGEKYLRFDREGSSQLVVHEVGVREGRFAPDIWGIAYCMNELRLSQGTINVVPQPSASPQYVWTLSLRLAFLSDLFAPSFRFLMKGSEAYLDKKHEMQNGIGTRYATYDSTNLKLESHRTKGKQSKVNAKESREEERFIRDPDSRLPGEFVGILRRQFPANIFKLRTSNSPVRFKEDDRITKKLWIDLMGVNQARELSVLELKVGRNVSLDVFAQAFDYGVYCHLFLNHLKRTFEDFHAATSSKVAVYILADKLHPLILSTPNDDRKAISSVLPRNNVFRIVFVQENSIRYDSDSQ